MRRELLMPRVGEDITAELAILQRELEAAQTTIRDLRRQIDNMQGRYQELARAYEMTVANLVRTSSTCATLERERDQWRQRAEGRSTPAAFQPGGLVLSSAEIAALRKAMARLHHPDTGGDIERMKVWNALLDILENEPI